MRAQDEEEKLITPFISSSHKDGYFSEGEQRVLSRSNSCESNNSLSDNLNTWNEWAGSNNQFSTLDFLEENPDPLAGGFLSLFKRD